MLVFDINKLICNLTNFSFELDFKRKVSTFIYFNNYNYNIYIELDRYISSVIISEKMKLVYMQTTSGDHASHTCNLYVIIFMYSILSANFSCLFTLSICKHTLLTTHGKQVWSTFACSYRHQLPHWKPSGHTKINAGNQQVQGCPVGHPMSVNLTAARLLAMRNLIEAISEKKQKIEIKTHASAT